MSDRTDERVTTIEGALLCPDHGARDCSPLLNGCSRVNEAHAALASLAADAAETQTLREDLQKEIDLRRQVSDQLSGYWRERDAAVADRDRLTEALDLIGHGWDGDEFNDPADLVEEYASIARAALAGREGSDRGVETIEVTPVPIVDRDGNVIAKCDCRNRDGSASLVDIEGCPVHGGREGSDDA